MSIEQLKKMLGPVGFMLARTILRKIKIKFDTEQRKVCITSDGKTQEIGFDEIEQAVNEQI